jgi:hypothetical protein
MLCNGMSMFIKRYCGKREEKLGRLIGRSKMKWSGDSCISIMLNNAISKR